MKKLLGLFGAAALAVTVGCAQTDSGITTNVKSKFATDDIVKAYQIDVDTRDHVVTLRGEVDSAAARERAVQLASATNGVRDVVDQLVIDDTAATSGDLDVDVDSDADDIVKEGARETGNAIKDGAVKVKDGVEKAGEELVDAVTDDDNDSDNDGK
jgi:hypothetical protein